MTEIGASSIPRSVARRFNLGDLAITIAAISIWLTAARSSGFAEGYERWSPSTQDRAKQGTNLDIIKDGFYVAESGWLAGTISLVVMRLRHPRPNRRRLLRQSGCVACVSAGMAGLIVCGINWLNRLADRFVNDRFYGMFFDSYQPKNELVTYLPGIAVFVSWSILVLGGRWSSESIWIERAGRIVGFGWLAFVPVQLVLDALARYFI